MRMAFKEWSVVVDALASGRQIIILRKGGINEGRNGFQIDYPEFLLFPTLFHQQREAVIPEAQARFDAIARTFPSESSVRLEYFAKVVAIRHLDSFPGLEQLRGQHIWRDEVIAQRFEWGKDRSIHALAVRVFRLHEAIELPMLKSYGGCKSWIQLGRDIF